MANQAVVDGITKVLTDNGYTAPSDVSQLSGQVDTFITNSGFVAEPTPVEDAQDQAVDADEAKEAQDQAQVDADKAQTQTDEAADQAEDASAPAEVESTSPPAPTSL
jgi:hypothetical protein